MASDLARHAGIAYAIAGLLRALPIHAARGQLYLPADLMQRYGARAADVFAGNGDHRACAPCWPNCGCGRAIISAAARGLLDDAPPEIAPALLPVALVRPALDRMERRSYQPFQPGESAAMAAAMDALARGAQRHLRKAF